MDIVIFDDYRKVYNVHSIELISPEISCLNESICKENKAEIRAQ